MLGYRICRHQEQDKQQQAVFCRQSGRDLCGDQVCSWQVQGQLSSIYWQRCDSGHGHGDKTYTGCKRWYYYKENMGHHGRERCSCTAYYGWQQDCRPYYQGRPCQNNHERTGRILPGKDKADLRGYCWYTWRHDRCGSCWRKIRPRQDSYRRLICRQDAGGNRRGRPHYSLRQRGESESCTRIRCQMPGALSRRKAIGRDYRACKIARCGNHKHRAWHLLCIKRDSKEHTCRLSHDDRRSDYLQNRWQDRGCKKDNVSDKAQSLPCSRPEG